MDKARTFGGWALGFLSVLCIFNTPAPSFATEADVRSVLSQDLVRVWGQREKALSSDHDGALERANTAYVQVMKDSGLTRVEAATHALVREIDAALAVDDLKGALARLELLEAVGGDTPEAYWATARVQRADNLLGVHRWALSWCRGVWERVTAPDRFGNDILFCLTVAFVFAVLFGGFFRVFQTARYGLHIGLGASRVFPGAYGWVSAVLTFVCLLGGTFYYLGVLSGLCLWCGLLAIYQSPGERVTLSMVLVGLLLAPYSLRLIDTGVQAAVVDVGALYKKSRNAAEKNSASSSRSGLGHLVDGLTYKRLGQFELAKEALGRADKEIGSNKGLRASLHNTYGAVYFGMRDWQKAQRHFEKASQFAPGTAAPVFNLHRVFTRIGDKDEAEAMARSASRLDARSVVSWEAEEGGQLNRVVVDLVPSRLSYASLLLEKVWMGLQEPSHLWQGLVGDRVVRMGPVSAGLTLLFIFIIGRFRSRLRVEWPCDRCALPVPVRLVDIDLTSPVCDQCTNIFLRTVPVDRRVRFAKEAMVSRWAFARRWGTRMVAFVVPGAAQVVRGDLKGGGLLVAVGCLALTVWLLPGPWVDVGGFDSGSPLWNWAAIGAYLLVLWFGIRDAFRQSKQGGAWP